MTRALNEGARKSPRSTKMAQDSNQRDMSKLVPKVERLSAEDGGGFVAYYPEIGKFTAYGTSDTCPDEAVRRLKEIAPQVIAHLESLGYTI